MSNEVTIEQMNEVIARFMGGTRVLHPEQKFFNEDFYGYVCHDGRWWNEKCLKYHTSWDWLMPVVEKISKMPLLNHDNTPCTDPQDVCYPYTFGMPNEHCGGVMVRIKGFGLHISDTLIEATFQAVYEVAEYHNQQKQTNGSLSES